MGTRGRGETPRMNQGISSFENLSFISTTEVGGLKPLAATALTQVNLRVSPSPRLRVFFGQISGRAFLSLYTSMTQTIYDTKTQLSVLTGKLERSLPYNWFPTPRKIALQLIDLADIKPYHKVLEPEAGAGDIALLIRATTPHVDVGEIHPLMQQILMLHGFNLVHADFLSTTPNPVYDRIVMNPPFSADIQHILHAYQFLARDGILVSLVSASWKLPAALPLRRLIKTHGNIIKLPEKSFRESKRPTDVAVWIITLHKTSRTEANGWTIELRTNFGVIRNPAGEIHTTYFGFEDPFKAQDFIDYLHSQHRCTKAKLRYSERLSTPYEVKVWGADTSILHSCNFEIQR